MASGRTTRSDDILIQANEFLSQRNPHEAIKLYTKILYTVSPGHVCALLNRALAYLCLQHPELAVVDAYRAAISAYSMRRANIRSNNRYIDVCQYLCTERVHVEKDKVWTGDHCRFIGTNWASSPLSSIVINDTPVYVSVNLDTVPTFLPENRKEICETLEVRAIYRLAGSLSLCGGGARSDAIGILDDARTRYGKLRSWEMCEYKRLGDGILNNLLRDLEPSASRPGGLGLTSSGVNTNDNQEVRQQIKAEMKSKATMIKGHNYSFDDFEPNLHVEVWQNYIISWVNRCAKTCSAHIITPSDSRDSPDSPGVSSKLYLELHALQDIRSGVKVLSEQTDSNVTTSTPEDVMATSTLESTDRFFCDTCATLLIVPGDSPDNYSGSLPFLPSELRPDLVGRANSPKEENSVIDPVLFPGGQARRPSPPSGHSSEAGDLNASMSSEFMFCCTTHMAPTCCDRCRRHHENLDHGLCHTNIERELRKGQLNDLRTMTPDDRKIQCLQELLFLRIFVTTLTAPNQNSHHLHHDDVMFASINPNNYHKAEEKQPWSFTNNVIRPLYNISQVCASLDIDPFTTLWQTDGWMINTLMSKIATSMRISKGPRYAKIYNKHANLKTAYGKFDHRWNRYVVPNEPDEEDQVWIGSITPVFNLIRIVDPSKDEKPNVVVVQKMGVHVYSISAIKRGEALLRAADGNETEGPVPEGWMLDEAEEWESEEEGGEEEGKGKGREGGEALDAANE